MTTTKKSNKKSTKSKSAKRVLNTLKQEEKTLKKVTMRPKPKKTKGVVRIETNKLQQKYDANDRGNHLGMPTRYKQNAVSKHLRGIHDVAMQLALHQAEPLNVPAPRLGFGGFPTQVVTLTQFFQVPGMLNTDNTRSQFIALKPMNNMPMIYQTSGRASNDISWGAAGTSGANWAQNIKVSDAFTGWRVLSFAIEWSISTTENSFNPVVSAGVTPSPPSDSAFRLAMNNNLALSPNGFPSTSAPIARSGRVCAKPMGRTALEMMIGYNSTTSALYPDDWAWPNLAITQFTTTPATNDFSVYFKCSLTAECYIDQTKYGNSLADNENVGEGDQYDIETIYSILDNLPPTRATRTVFGLAKVGAALADIASNGIPAMYGNGRTAQASASSELTSKFSVDPTSLDAISTSESIIRDNARLQENTKQIQRLLQLLPAIENGLAAVEQKLDDASGSSNRRESLGEISNCEDLSSLALSDLPSELNTNNSVLIKVAQLLQATKRH